jgi:hypothetical protein
MTFYLPQESPVPNQETLEHFERVLIELAMALEVISNAQASEALKQTCEARFADE